MENEVDVEVVVNEMENEVDVEVENVVDYEETIED